MASFKRLLFVTVQGKVLDTAFRGESVRQPIDSIISRLEKIEAGGVCHTWQSVGYFSAASPFP
jgi:hypothetical protein